MSIDPELAAKAIVGGEFSAAELARRDVAAFAWNARDQAEELSFIITPAAIAILRLAQQSGKSRDPEIRPNLLEISRLVPKADIDASLAAYIATLKEDP